MVYRLQSEVQEHLGTCDRRPSRPMRQLGPDGEAGARWVSSGYKDTDDQGRRTSENYVSQREQREAVVVKVTPEDD